ncbi:MAG: hypothetical protein NTV31_04405 [Bacteroidia bacterium]|nr:hypothetical protein [Bacteroidia bacterium]
MPARTKIEIKLNSYGDIIEYKWVVKDLIDKVHYESILEGLTYQFDYQLEYTYNEKKDWTKIIFKVNNIRPDVQEYIITREIQYID